MGDQDISRQAVAATGWAVFGATHNRGDLGQSGAFCCPFMSLADVASESVEAGRFSQWACCRKQCIVRACSFSTEVLREDEISTP